MNELIGVTPEPTESELAAIIAAYDALWPTPVASSNGHGHRPSPWRFSGRWWTEASRWGGW